MPKNKNAYLRYRAIDRLLSTGRTFSKKQLLEGIENDLGFEVSTFTFDKDLQVLRYNLQAPIEYDSGLKGYYYTDKKFSLFKTELDDNETSALEFASEALNTLSNVELVQEAQTVLANLYGRIQQAEKRSGQQIIFKPTTTPVKGVEWLNELYKTIEQERAITIKYYKLQTDEIKTHTISPYILRQYNDLWYVIAWSADRELTLVFALDRIREISSANVSYFVDTKFDPELYFKYSYGITHSHYDSPCEIKLWIRNDAYFYLQVKPLHSSQKELEKQDMGVIIRIEVIISEELVMGLLALGDKIRVIEPKSLEDRIKTELDQARAEYQNLTL
jgi:predicted DNA-binding transcriptional regulator YafY